MIKRLSLLALGAFFLGNSSVATASDIEVSASLQKKSLSGDVIYMQILNYQTESLKRRNTLLNI
ncbi:hypothetical protein [Pleionea litopenaei]|uniref:Uncharacterized protein n=1 Tax=Pleionea litopenaei TaxID=3070815 RepID=A0AA51RRG1_9GAMM|nr:hypothetical protein [Pleionea sp. HL-JVS1]WMS86277.1 hypothetical protein Q9312_13715 [Pleionea sp. HL-JVS1]